MTKKDYIFGFLAGFLIGILAMPVLKASNPETYDKFGVYLLPLFLIATPVGLWIANKISARIAVVWQIAKFGVSGVLNTVLDWGVLTFLIFYSNSRFGINSDQVIFSVVTFYVLFKAVAFIVANINSYYWNKFWTFAERTAKKTREEYLQFLMVSVIGFLLNTGIAALIFRLASAAGTFTESQSGVLGAAVGSVVVFIWNFLGYKFIVFKPKTADGFSRV